MKNFDIRLVNLVLSCFILPLFIGDENEGRKLNRFVGTRPNKRQNRNKSLGATQQIFLLSVDRAVDHQRSDSDRWESGRPDGRPWIPNRE